MWWLEVREHDSPPVREEELNMEGRRDTLKAFLFQGLWARVGGDKGVFEAAELQKIVDGKGE